MAAINNNNGVRATNSATGGESVWQYGGPGQLKEGAWNYEKDWTVCRCKMHTKSQEGVPVGLGCWGTPIGKHPAVRAAHLDGHKHCGVVEKVRYKDAQFYKLCDMQGKRGLMAYAHPFGYAQAAKRFATGISTLKDFGRGYCYLKGIRSGYLNRVARVFGPNLYLLDFLKVLCIAGECDMYPLIVVEIAEGLLHVEFQQGGVLTAGAGSEFYASLVEYVVDHPNARIGGSVDMPVRNGISLKVKTLQFGAMPVGGVGYNCANVKELVPAKSWEGSVGAEILGLVRWHMGENLSDALAVRMHVMTLAERKAGRNVRNRQKKKAKKTKVDTKRVSIATERKSMETHGELINLLDVDEKCGFSTSLVCEDVLGLVFPGTVSGPVDWSEMVEEEQKEKEFMGECGVLQEVVSENW